MSKQGFMGYLNSGEFDDGDVADYSRKNLGIRELKASLLSNASAYSVSQYFNMGSAVRPDTRSQRLFPLRRHPD